MINVQKNHPIHYPTHFPTHLELLGFWMIFCPFLQGKGAGTGTAAYSSPEEVAKAITTLNGCLGRDLALGMERHGMGLDGGKR